MFRTTGSSLNHERSNVTAESWYTVGRTFFMMAYICSLKLETRLSVESEEREGKIRGSRNTLKC